MEQNNIYQEESIDIKKYLFKFLFNWYWFAIALGIALSIAYMVNRYSEPTYTISSSIIVGDKQTEAASIESIIEEMGIRRRNRKAVVENEISILKSYQLARAALEQLDFEITYVAVGRREIAETKLYKHCPFVVIPAEDHTQLQYYPVNVKILSNREYLLEINDKFNIKKTLQFGESFENESFKFKIVLRNPEEFMFREDNSNKYYFHFNNINSLSNAYRNKLNVSVNDQKGSILTLRINGFVPEKMANYLNTLSQVYIQSDLDEKNQKVFNTLLFINEQLDTLVKNLNLSEKKLQEFRSNNQVFSLSQKGTQLFDELSEMQSLQIPFEIKDYYLEYLLDYLNEDSNDNFLVAPTILNISDPVLQKMVEEYNMLVSDQLKFSEVAKEDAPNLAILENEITILQNKLISYVISNQKTNTLTIETYKQKENQLNLEIQKLPINERALINIEREYKLNNQLYTFLLEKRAEAGITKASTTSDHKILDIARPENAGRLSPKRSKNYMLALILGLGVPGALILLFEFMNTKIEDKKDIERSTNIPIIGTIGHNEISADIPVFLDPKSSLAESFRTLRTNLQFVLKNKDQKVVMVTSTISGEGKTFAAVNLAAISALSGKKVLLVGLDLRKPSLHKIFDVSNETGISNYLIQQSEYGDIIRETVNENLFLAPSGPIPPNPAELIETQRMKAFFDQAQKDFNLIIIDTPPIALVTDALLASSYSSTTLYLIRQRYSTKQVFELINKLDREKKIGDVNILVNDIKVPRYYGYYYNYGYSYGYGYGYGYHQTNKKRKFFNLK